jgi:geranylgeranyl diphosphate synthase, type I
VSQGGDVPPNAPSPANTLASTDALLADVCARLASRWHERSPDAPPVLGDDLPELLLSWVLPAGGKRLRPTLCHWGWVAGGGSPSELDHLVATCAALDLVHLFALVHDDVMDRSDSRRGRVTVHVEAAKSHAGAGALGDPVLFGDSIAILFGDLALSEAWGLVAGVGPALRAAWGEMLRELVQGQLLDVTGAAGRSRDLERARLVARLKSGAYTVQRPLELGAIAADSPPDAIAALSRFGDHLGEAFALRDDVLGVWGDPRGTGKPVGDDLLSSKPTVLLAEAARLLPRDVSERYLGVAGAITPDDVPVVQQLMLDAGVRSRVEERIRAEVERACAALDDAPLDPVATQRLRDLTTSIAWRES